MENLTYPLQALGTGDAGSSGLGSRLTKAPALDSPTTPRPSLETLPVELQCLIMSKALDFTSLSALIHASPELHRVYAENRMTVLRDIATQTLEGIGVDALGAYRSGTEAFKKIRDESLLWTFFEEQRARYSAGLLPSASDWTAELSLDEIIHVLRFHISVVEPLTEAFAHWALGALPSEPENEAACKSVSLGDVERCRMQRGLYRMQMLCNVYGSKRRRILSIMGDIVDRMRVLSMFPAWEVEEILSVHEFAKDKYANVFKQVAWDLDEERNPKYRHIDITSVNQDMLLTWSPTYGSNGKYPSIQTNGDQSLTCCIALNEKSLNAVLRHGPDLLANTFKAKSQEQLVEIIRAAIESSQRQLGGVYPFDWLDETLDELAQGERRDQWPTRHDSAQDFMQKTPFDGDKLDSPPLAWILYWRGEYSNLFGRYIPEALRRWGFVMWDAARLDLDAKDSIEQAWCGNNYHYADPREDDYDSSVVDSPT